MNDYKELIEELKRNGISNGGALGRHSGLCDEAADAIERLVKERDDEREAADEWQHDYFELARKCGQLEKERDEWKTLGEFANKRAEDYREMRRKRDEAIKERDAAIADIACLANDPNVPAESLCKKFTNHGCCCYNYYTGEQVRDCTGFEWRGVREVEHE